MSGPAAKHTLPAEGGSTHRHVGSTAGAAGLGLRVNEAPADAEVAQLDLTFSVQEDVGGFDIPVDDTVFLFQVQQGLHDLRRHQQLKKKQLHSFLRLLSTYCHCHLSKDPLWDGALDSFL